MEGKFVPLYLFSFHQKEVSIVLQTIWALYVWQPILCILAPENDGLIKQYSAHITTMSQAL